MKRVVIVISACLAFIATGAEPPPPPEEQIAAAVQAAPEDRRAGAAVLGYNAAGELVTLRPGTNDMVCLADNPSAKGWEVDCYHKDLDPFMARGRELAAQGVQGRDRHEKRYQEVREGKLTMPREPRMLYVLTGDGFDASAGKVVKPYLRWVVYVPNATPESIGLPAKASNGPWLMYPGTPGAHIMISPPK
jgi:hypothetical protein